MFHSPFNPIIYISNAHSTGFFVDDTNCFRVGKVVLHKELKGQRSHFTKEGNLELILFDLGNNFDHASLRLKDHFQVVTTPLPNKNAVTGELITPAQIIAKKMVVASEDDDDDVGDEH
jgi:hypothetical protein